MAFLGGVFYLVGFGIMSGFSGNGEKQTKMVKSILEQRTGLNVELQYLNYFSVVPSFQIDVDGLSFAKAGQQDDFVFTSDELLLKSNVFSQSLLPEVLFIKNAILGAKIISDKALQFESVRWMKSTAISDTVQNQLNPNISPEKLSFDTAQFVLVYGDKEIIGEVKPDLIKRQVTGAIQAESLDLQQMFIPYIKEKPLKNLWIDKIVIAFQTDRLVLSDGEKHAQSAGHVILNLAGQQAYLLFIAKDTKQCIDLFNQKPQEMKICEAFL
jgi:hypothetical protein